MTLNGEMALSLFCVISPNSEASGAHCVKWLKINVKILQQKCSPKHLVFSDILRTPIRYTWYRQFRIIGVSLEFPSVFYYLLVRLFGMLSLARRRCCIAVVSMLAISLHEFFIVACNFARFHTFIIVTNCIDINRIMNYNRNRQYGWMELR